MLIIVRLTEVNSDPSPIFCLRFLWLAGKSCTIDFVFQFIFYLTFPQSVSTPLLSIQIICENLWCTGWQSMAWQNLCSKFLDCLHSSISGMLVWASPLPPPPRKYRFGQIMDYVGTGVWRLIAVSQRIPFRLNCTEKYKLLLHVGIIWRTVFQ